MIEFRNYNHHHQLLHHNQRSMASAFSAIPILSHLIIALLLVASTASFNGANGELVIETNQREFDYFKLALQWPSTYCRNTRKCCSKNGCCRSSGPPMHFTIHGLWPDYNDGSWPACCTKSAFDKKEISTLSDALDEYWPTLSCGSPSTCHGHRGSFWAHEWEKHGTCSSPVVKDEYQYFLTGLNVFFKYNVTEVLNEEGYLPSNSEKYPLGGVISAIENAFHQSPMVVCSGDAVKEIHLCFSKSFQPRECADYSRSSCPNYVSLPIYDPSGLRNFSTYESIAI